MIDDTTGLAITVQGEHTSFVTPERATLHLTAGFESGSAEDAARRTGELVNALAEELRALQSGSRGAARAPVAKFVVNPMGTRSWRPYSDRGAILPMRYSATARLSAEFVDFGALASFTAAFGSLPGVSLGWVEWDLTDETRTVCEAEALKAAVERARSRALAIAFAAGADDVVAYEFADPGLLSQPTAAQAEALPAPMMLRATGGAEQAVFDIVPEDIEIRVRIQGRFRTR